MKVEIPDNLLAGAHISKEDVMLDLALGMFIDRRLSLARAAKLAGRSISVFMHELGKRSVPIHYEDEDLAMDIKTVALFREQMERYDA